MLLCDVFDKEAKRCWLTRVSSHSPLTACFRGVLGFSWMDLSGVLPCTPAFGISSSVVFTTCLCDGAYQTVRVLSARRRRGLRFSSQPIVRLRVLKDSTSFSTEADSASDVIGTKELSSAPQVFNANVRSSVVLFSGCLVPSKSIARVASCQSPSAAVLVLYVISIYSFGAEIFISRLPELDGHCSLGAPLLWRVAP